MAAIVDNIGTYLSSINTIYNNTGTIGESDGDIQISLNEGHAPTADYVERLRNELPRRFPGMTFSFLPADIVSQILNFGAPAPIDLQVRGNDLGADYAYANKLLAQVRHVTGVADARIQQSAAQPTLDVDIDRTRAQYTGVTAADVTNSLVVNLASSIQVAPTYWLNEKNGVTYPIALQTPQYQIDTLPALQNLPINATRRADHGARRHRRHPSHPQRCRGLAVRHRADGGDLRDDPGARSRRGLARHPARSSPRTTRTSRKARSSPWSARRRP